jgi:hypothetical protein
MHRSKISSFNITPDPHTCLGFAGEYDDSAHEKDKTYEK